MKTIIAIYPIFAALGLTGCVSGTSSSKLSESHPAQPQAPRSPEALPTPMLIAGSQGLVLPVSTNQTEMQHGQHQQTPASKGAADPAHKNHPPTSQTKMMMGDDAMNVMGAMPGEAMAQSALPGVPGVSHLYHIGAAGFFLDHQEHIQLSTEQQKKLNQIRENALLEKATADRNVEEAEQQLWKLTAVDQPDLAPIEAKVREIEKLRSDQRLTLIRPVVEAAKVLTEEQTKILLGTAAPVMPDMPATKPATPGSKPAEKATAKPEHKH